MAEETISILNVDVSPAVKSIADLRENIKNLKERLEGLDIGTTEYKETLVELKVNQNALKDAMHATNVNMEDLVDSAKGASTTYNSLVHRMADLKTQLRATDVSTAEGRKHFEDLANQINETNNALKEMDELQGNFQRNVGNYPGTIKKWSGSLDALDKGIKAATGDLGMMKNGMDAIVVNPIVTILGLVIALFGSLSENVKESESGMAALNEASLSLKPIMNFFKAILDKIVVVVVDLIKEVSEFVNSNGLFNKIINGIVGIGNAIVQFVIAPYKAVMDAIRIFKEQGVGGFRDALKVINDDLNKGIAFKTNFQSGKDIVNSVMEGFKESTPKAKETATKAGEDIGKSLADGIMKDFEKALAIANKKFDEELKERLENQKFADDLMLEEEERFNAEMEKYWEEQERLEDEKKQKEEERAKARIATMQSVVNATSGILGTLADLYESDEKNSEKNANKVKALRIASAMIDTISGAIGAFTQASETIPPPYGQIVGAASASLVTATGLAQIAKIKSTKVSGSASNSSASVSGITSAPTTTMDIPQVRNVTSASEEDRLNQMASDQRVVLVMSDLEVKTNQSRVNVVETSF